MLVAGYPANITQFSCLQTLERLIVEVWLSISYNLQVHKYSLQLVTTTSNAFGI